MIYTCLHCGDSDEYPDDGPRPEEDIVRCSKCLGVTAFGRRIPRIFIEPDPRGDARFVQIRFDSAIAIQLPREFAGHTALEILSVCRPRSPEPPQKIVDGVLEEPDAPTHLSG